ncbi:hypothetical protein C8R45DRAFT_841390 [Mycena sanguinolenta]|nr:hypothetical protein C8R45DRAFT_841390 [Mycena sanguinolenta]
MVQTARVSYGARTNSVISPLLHHANSCSSSTHNTRIERLWVEVGSQFVRRWRGFFNRLERLHHLDPDRPDHLWLLHTLFLDSINEDCEEFQSNWNAHPIDGMGTANKSPNDLRLLGQVRHGVYQDECQGLHPETIEKYYGVYGTARAGRQGGAGIPPDENDAEEPGIAEHIRADQGPQIRHDAIEVPDHKNPFSEDPETEEQFYAVFEHIVRQDITPVGYGVLSEEWDEDGYPDVEILSGGKQMKTRVTISLAHPIWLQRAKLWAQGLNVLGQV